MENDHAGILLSIIVPIYKVEQYLEQCIESIVRQQSKDIEVILVDDGSPDSCPAICDSYAQRYDNVFAIHKQNGGCVSARKAGVSAARGEYITFVDGDDWVTEDYCSSIINIITQYSPDIIIAERYYRAESDLTITQQKSTDKNGFYDKTTIEHDVLPEILYKPPFYNFGVLPALWLKALKRDLVENCLKNVPNIVTMGEDLCLSLPAFFLAQSVYFADICVYYYRMNPTSITHSFDRDSPERIEVLIDYLEKATEQYDRFGIGSQLDMYTAWIVSCTAKSIAVGSSNIAQDLDAIYNLIQNEHVKRALMHRISVKAWLLLFLAAKKCTRSLKLIKSCIKLRDCLLQRP